MKALRSDQKADCLEDSAMEEEQPPGLQSRVRRRDRAGPVSGSDRPEAGAARIRIMTLNERRSEWFMLSLALHAEESQHTSGRIHSREILSLILM